jgi:phage-Barnase-EndoU-ColicinE5/D-RelE like nuclease3
LTRLALAAQAAIKMWRHTGHQAFEFGIVSNDDAARILRQTGLNIAGFLRVMATRGVRHVKNNHADPVREAAQQQYAVVPADFALIPQIATIGSTRLFGKFGGRKPARLEHRAIVNNRIYVYIETVGAKEKRLELWTMRIEQMDKGKG